MDPNLKLCFIDGEPLQDSSQFIRLLGRLLYLTIPIHLSYYHITSKCCASPPYHKDTLSTCLIFSTSHLYPLRHIQTQIWEIAYIHAKAPRVDVFSWENPLYTGNMKSRRIVSWSSAEADIAPLLPWQVNYNGYAPSTQGV